MPNTIRTALDTAIETFVRDIAELFAEAVGRAPITQVPSSVERAPAPRRTSPRRAAILSATPAAPVAPPAAAPVAAAPLAVAPGAAAPVVPPAVAPAPTATPATVPAAQHSSPPRPAPMRNLVPLRRGTDIHAHAARPQPAPTVLPAFLRALEPERPKGPTPEQLAERVISVLWAAEGPLVFERIRLALATKKDILVPVLDKLLAENRVTAIELDGVTAYKPPRIEPIRRRRSAEA